jgi:hypothetical protein
MEMVGSPGLHTANSLYGAGPSLRSSVAGSCVHSARGFAPDIRLCTGLLGWLRARVARLRSPVVALKTSARMAGSRRRA